MAQLSIIDVKNHHKSHLKHFVVQTRTFQIEKSRNVSMYPRLRDYIKKQNEKRKQEMEMSEELKRAKREKELKHNQDKFTLGEIKEEIAKQERLLIDLENEKHKLFAEFKKVLNEDDNRKNLQRQKEANAITSMTFGQPHISTQSSSTIPPSPSTSSSSPSMAPSSNQSPLKFAPPPPIPQHPPPPPTGPTMTNPTIIPNSTMLLHNPYYSHSTSLPPPPPPIMANNGLSSSTSYSQSQNRSLNNGCYSQKQPTMNNNPQSIYSKNGMPPSIVPILPINQTPGNNALLNTAVSLSSPFQPMPTVISNDRQSQHQHRSLSSFKNQAPPPVSVHQSMAAYIPGYNKQPPPPGPHGHHPGVPPFAGLTIEQMQILSMMMPYPPNPNAK